jgi:hypothetical protein
LINTSFLQNFYCKLSIDNHPLIAKNIVTCVIREWIFDLLPRIELTIQDDGYLTELFPILDLATLDIEFGVSPDDPNIISTQFMIINKVIDNIQSNKASMISLTGLLKTDDMFTKVRNRHFSKQTSKDVINKLSVESGLSFTPNINLSSTSDLMTWYQINVNNYKFLQQIQKRWYKPDDILFCYASLDSKLILTSYKCAINNVSKICRYSVPLFTEYASKEVLNGSKELYYKSFNVVNYSGQYNMEYGYGVGGSYYDYSTNSSINLNSTYHPLTELSDEQFEGNSVYKKVFPNKNTNAHDNYFRTFLQNKYYKKLFNISLLLDINAMGKVTLFDKVDVFINSLLNDEKDEVNSGEYLVCGITHSFGNNQLYRKQISVHRNGYNKPTLV